MKDFPDFTGQALQGEGFLQECRSRIERPLVEDCVFGIAGKVEHSELRPNLE